MAGAAQARSQWHGSALGSRQLGHSHSFQIKVPPGNSLEPDTGLGWGDGASWHSSGGGRGKAGTCPQLQGPQASSLGRGLDTLPHTYFSPSPILG